MSFWRLIFLELKSALRNPVVVLTVFGGVLFYSFLYPLPYGKQVPREQSVVVVNLDQSQLSRQLERMVDATPQVRLVDRADSIEEAEEIFIRDRLAGILVIPEHFYRDLLLGRQPTLSYAGDASYFLVYGTVLEGLAGAGGTVAAKVKIQKMVMAGQPLPLAVEQHSAVHMNLRSVFNPTSGYVNYVIPAVFILILHQTLVISAGVVGASHNEIRAQGGSGYWLEVSPLKLLLARTVVFTSIYWLLCMYYFGFGFDFYHIPHKAGLAELQLVMLPFLLGASLLGTVIGALVPRRELATLLVLVSSMPLIFGSGFIWPVEMMPAGVTALFQLIPVVPAMKMFLCLNQMGADFAELLPLWKQLWICVLVNGGGAWLLLRYREVSLSRRKPVGSE